MGTSRTLFFASEETFGRMPDVVLSNAGVVEEDLVRAGEHDVEAWWHVVMSTSICPVQ
jgi:hypothetical protein